MDYRELPPPPEVAEHVRCLWTLRGDGSTNREHVVCDAAAGTTDAEAEAALPDGSPELIFNFGAPFEYLSPDGGRIRQPQAFLVGQITRPFAVVATGAVELLAVRFDAHGAALACDDVGALLNTWLSIESLPACGVVELAVALRERADPGARIDLVSDWLRGLVRERHAAHPQVVAAVHAIRRSHGAANVDALCESLAVSPRTLQRLFARQVGITPKLLARIVRFQCVLRAWRSDQGTFARVAVESGYFDQSHLVRDFRDFAGAPPAGFLAALPVFTAQFLS
ncbi:MAG: helix-turn-helix domain-containing protein [Gemmatimonadota bacterium]